MGSISALIFHRLLPGFRRLCIPNRKFLPLRTKFLNNVGVEYVQEQTLRFYSHFNLHLEILLPHSHGSYLLVSSAHAKPQVHSFASYPHAKSVFKSGRNQGFPLVAGSLVFPEFRVQRISALFSGIFSQPAHFRSEKWSPTRHFSHMAGSWQTPAPIQGTPVAGWPRPPQDVRPLLKSSTRAHSHMSQSWLSPVGILLLAGPSVVLIGQGSSNASTPVTSCFFLGWLNIWARVHPWIHLLTSAVENPPRFNILASYWHSISSILFQQDWTTFVVI